MSQVLKPDPARYATIVNTVRCVAFVKHMCYTEFVKNKCYTDIVNNARYTVFVNNLHNATIYLYNDGLDFAVQKG